MQQKGYKNNLKKYARVWLLSFKASLKRSNVYKGELVVRILRTIFILVTQLILVTVVYGDQEVLMGWTKVESYLVLGIWNLLNYSGWAFFGINLSALEGKVLTGDFDFTLLKPISSAWLTSFGDFSLYNGISTLSGIILIGYYFVINWAYLSFMNVVLGFLGVGIGLIIWYAIYLLFASFTISIPRNGFIAVAKEILGWSRYPMSLYPGIIQVVLYSVIPIAFLSTIPAELIVGRGNVILLLIGLGISIVLLRFSFWVWKMNVKRYTSAGG